MHILMMGPQACGKGTIGEMLSKKLNIPLISTGQILRGLMPQSPWYKEIHNAMVQGILAPNDIVAEILKLETEKEIYKIGYILDGWARQMSDLKYLDPIFDYVVVINVSRETSLKRISGRRICSVDGETYNIDAMSKEELEKCKGTLTQREDDTVDAVNKRLEIYHTETVKVIDSYRKKGIVIEVSGEKSAGEVLNDVLKQIDVRSKVLQLF